MQTMESFENINDLLIFVLDKCSDMKFSFSQTSRGFSKPYCVGLKITSNPNLQMICYADILLREHFDVYIDSLEINSSSIMVFNIDNANALHIDVEGEYIRNMDKLRELGLKTTTQERISDLPDSIQKLTLNRQTVVNLLGDDSLERYNERNWASNVKDYEIGGQYFYYTGYFNGLYFFTKSKYIKTA